MVAIILYYIIIYTLLYIEEKQKQAEGKEEREPGRRMPPPSSPVPRFSSVPSAAATYHQFQPLTTSPACVSEQGEGRAATSAASGRCY